MVKRKGHFAPPIVTIYIYPRIFIYNSNNPVWNVQFVWKELPLTNRLLFRVIIRFVNIVFIVDQHESVRDMSML